MAIGVPIYTVLGNLIASDNADLWDGLIDSPINIDQNGGVRDTRVYTGTDATGVARIALGAFLFTDVHTTGGSNQADSLWINSDTPLPATTQHLRPKRNNHGPNCKRRHPCPGAQPLCLARRRARNVRLCAATPS